jgi:predicted HTH transcriptional regulator
MKVWQKRKTDKNIHFEYTASTQELLLLLQEAGQISLKETRQITGLSKYRAEQILSDLIVLGVIEMKMKETETTFVSKVHPED